MHHISGPGSSIMFTLVHLKICSSNKIDNTVSKSCSFRSNQINHTISTVVSQKHQERNAINATLRPPSRDTFRSVPQTYQPGKIRDCQGKRWRMHLLSSCIIRLPSAVTAALKSSAIAAINQEDNSVFAVHQWHSLWTQLGQRNKLA